MRTAGTGEMQLETVSAASSDSNHRLKLKKREAKYEGKQLEAKNHALMLFGKTHKYEEYLDS